MNDTEDIHCRLCAELKPQNKLEDLRTDDEKCQEIVSKLTRLNIEINLKDDNLPKVACFTCVNSLQRAYDFITVVEQAQSTINELILTREVKKESHSDEEVDNFIYEPPVYHSNDIKEESEEKHLENTTVPNKIDISPVNKKKLKKSCNNLDALPLSQLNLSWNDYNWSCYLCGTQFPTLDELRSHSMEYHTVCNPYKCSDCNVRKLTLDRFLVHVQRHRKYLKFSCFQCSKRFSTTKESVKHRSQHKSMNYMCFGCYTSFDNEEKLNSHIDTFYRRTRGQEKRILVQTNSLTCPTCNKSFKSKGNLVTHLITHTDRKREHICEVCGKGFNYKGALVTHMVNHNDARPYKCEICKASFKTMRYLRFHVGAHNGEKPFACEQCGRCFRLKYQLSNHSIIHTDSLPHECTYCNKRFRFKSILSQHLRLHTGVRPYSCTLCQHDFTNWPNYNKHMKCRHGMNMAKKKFTTEGALPIDPATGDVISPKQNMKEWKEKIIEGPRNKSKKDKVKQSIDDTK